MHVSNTSNSMVLAVTKCHFLTISQISTILSSSSDSAFGYWIRQHSPKNIITMLFFSYFRFEVNFVWSSRISAISKMGKKGIYINPIKNLKKYWGSNFSAPDSTNFISIQRPYIKFFIKISHIMGNICQVG